MTAQNPHDVRSVISVRRWLSLIASSPSLSRCFIQKHCLLHKRSLSLRILFENQFGIGKRKHKTMRLLLFSLSLFCLLAVISAKKQIQENNDPIEGETKAHSSKKYSKEYQKAHHHGHNHKKHQVLDQPKEVDPEPKPAHADIPEPEIRLQSDIETSKKAIEEEKQKAEVEDLHLQDLTYEENLNKNKKKKKGHHHAENAKKQLKEKDQKLFAEQEEKNPVEEKVIEDSFEPLKEKRNEAEKKNKGKDKKSKDKTKNKKAYEKNKDKSKKNGKDGKKNKNKDKKNKNNKDKKKW